MVSYRDKVELVYSSKGAIFQGPEIIGGKAWGLAQLTLQGHRVPNWMVIPANSWNLQKEQNGLSVWLEEMISQIDIEKPVKKDVSSLSDLIFKKITETKLHPMLEETIITQFKIHALSEDTFYAVRSSVVGEDSVHASFAGQMNSFLYCRGIDSIMDAIKKCWASAFSDRALLYRVMKQITVQKLEMAVIIQEMIDSDISGVLYTAHPRTGNRKTAVLSSTYGLCAGVVSGECDTDEYVVHLIDKSIQTTIGHKKTMYVFDRLQGSGIKINTIVKEKHNRPSLKESQVLEIVRIGMDIANQMKGPQDIEWTIKRDQVFILQSRPITALPLDENSKQQNIVWDNSNIQESYCGVTTPLTFSFASKAYAIVYEQLMRIMGLSEKVIQEHKPILTNLLGFIKGRIYYNINNWYKALLLLPSFDTNKASMERMMGLQNPVEFIQDNKLSYLQKVKRASRFFLIALKQYWKFMRMAKLVIHFQSHFDSVQSEFNKKKLSLMSIPELIHLTKWLDQKLLYKWHTPILNDFFVMMYNGKIIRFLEKINFPFPEETLNKLIAGEKDIESINPTIILLQMASIIRNDSNLSNLFDNYSDEQLLPEIRMINPTFYLDCQDYILRYGDRIPGELKLESLSLREDPSYIFMFLRNFLNRSDLTKEKITEKKNKLREETEKRTREILQKTRGMRTTGFWRDLKKLRRGVLYRENMRMARTRLFGFYRDIYLEIGDRFSAASILETRRDIFFLTVNEINHLSEGRAVQTNLIAIVSSRKNEYEHYETLELPNQFKTSEMIYYQQDYAPLQMDRSIANGSLYGTGCYPGVVQEKVKVIQSYKGGVQLDGQILCAQRTDPGWTPLFPACSGILVESGSTLSHSAVIARELGIPTIVGIPGLIKQIKTGDRIWMNGETGEVRIGKD